ncbi:Ig-like domain-containing protein [Clostridium sp. BNL1100]|uniref:Ig-like domain-containing protein n=1 Tax=Clostridium sp. BNL1100 TaxID=755731 RepID=UPI00024A7536|nr:Ig-like domain-containing protein [Clostridium sp. BNL1100]AEY67298.1 Ig-like domain-containing protein,Transglutaminase-like superfamily protein [Clostridium sp. BNL1100]
MNSYSKLRVLLTMVLALLITMSSLYNPFIANANGNEVLSVENPNGTIFINEGDSYSLPQTIPATLADGSRADVAVIWQSAKINTHNEGIYQLVGSIAGYSEKINWNLIVNPVVYTVLRQAYVLPQTLPYFPADSTGYEVEVAWDSQTADTTNPGTYKYVGSIEGLSLQVALTLNVAGEIASLKYYAWGEDAYQGIDYSLPETVEVNIVGGGTARVPVIWTPSVIDLSVLGNFKFVGRIEGFSREMTLTVNVNPPIVSFVGMPVTVPQYGSVKMPVTVAAQLSNGTYKLGFDNVTWNTEMLDVTKAGEYKVEGIVKGFLQKAYVTVTVVPQYTIEDIRASVKKGEPYDLPATVKAKRYDGTVVDLPVEWNTTSVDTTIEGTQNFEGKVEGYEGTVKLTLIVQTEDIVYIADPNLEKAVRSAISKPTGDILKSDMLKITYLNAKYLDIVSLEGIQYAKNLFMLYLTDNQVGDISQLSELTNLQYLFLNYNNIKSLIPLEKLSKLYMLGLESNQITDLSPLKNLTNLNNLGVDRNPLMDISCIKDFNTNISSLSMYSCKIEDISSLSVLKNLSTLRLGYNNIKDITSLSSLTNLQDVDLSDNAIEDFSTLSYLGKLTKLDLSGNSIRDYSSYTRFNDNIKIDFWGFSQTKAEITSFLTTADQIIASVVTPDMTPLEKEKALHDYICKNTNYTLGVYTGAYGVLIDKKGACDAIADTMNILLNRAGIECIKVAHGWAGGAHAWNIVKIEGKYYHLDCTWDTIYTKQNAALSYKYFNVNDAFLKSEGRTWDTTKYPICE